MWSILHPFFRPHRSHCDSPKGATPRPSCVSEKLLTQAPSFASYLVDRKHPANELREWGKPVSSDSMSEIWPFAAPTATESHCHLFFVRGLFIKDDFVVDFSHGELAFN
jgi:hypothetical protein